MCNCKATVALPSSGPCMFCWRYANSVPLVESITVLALKASKSSQMDLPQHTQPRLRGPGGCIVIVSYAGSTGDYHIDVSEVLLSITENLVPSSCFCDICMLHIHLCKCWDVQLMTIYAIHLIYYEKQNVCPILMLC